TGETCAAGTSDVRLQNAKRKRKGSGRQGDKETRRQGDKEISYPLVPPSPCLLIQPLPLHFRVLRALCPLRLLLPFVRAATEAGGSDAIRPRVRAEDQSADGD